MSAGKTVKYILAVMGIYYLLALGEFFTVLPLVRGLEPGWFMEMVGALIFLLAVNPLITYFISEKLPFAPEGLKTKGGIKENLKKPVEVQA